MLKPVNRYVYKVYPTSASSYERKRIVRLFLLSLFNGNSF